MYIAYHSMAQRDLEYETLCLQDPYFRCTPKKQWSYQG